MFVQIFAFLLILMHVISAENEESSCIVSSIEVQPDFDPNQFMGRWFNQMWLPPLESPPWTPGNSHTNYQHLYTMGEDGNVTIQIRGSPPLDRTICETFSGILVPTNVSGKYIYSYTYRVPGGSVREETVPYWIVYNDGNLAVSYGCLSVNVSGLCTNPVVSIWSRTPQVANVTSLKPKLESELCLNYDDFFQIEQIMSCSKESCEVDGIFVQPDFQLTRFLGRWFEYRWLPSQGLDPSSYYTNYQHRYQQYANGSVFAHGMARDPGRNLTCFSWDEQYVVNQYGVVAKFKRKFSETTYGDYWIVSTDYDHYAVAYACKERNSTGQCTEPKIWVWSRTPQFPRAFQQLTDRIIANDLCVDLRKTAVVPQFDSCSEEACEARGISVQEKFDLNKFMGRWFELQWLPPTAQAYEVYKDYKFIYALHTNGTVTVKITGRKENETECFGQHSLLDTTGTPGKLQYTTWRSPTEQVATDFWVTKTDYTSYAVVYGCRSINSTSGKCLKTDSMVLGRGATLSDSIWDIVMEEMEGICVNYQAYVNIVHNQDCKEKQPSAGRNLQPSLFVPPLLSLVVIWLCLLK